MSQITKDLKEVPTWVWLGGAAVGGLLFLVTHLGGNPNPLTATVTPQTADTASADQAPTIGGMSPFDVFNLVREMQGMGAQGGGVVTVPPSGQPGGTGPVSPSPSNPTAPTNPSNGNGGPSLTPQQQQLMGQYGGDPLNTTNPFSSIPGWENVTQTTYSGGGTLLNLGQAQPPPAVGAVIPPAVEDTPGQAPFIYGYGFKPGDTEQAGGGSLQSVLQQEIDAGVGTRQTAAESWDNTPVSIRGTGPNPFG